MEVNESKTDNQNIIELVQDMSDINKKLVTADLKIGFLDERLKKIESEYNIIQELSSSILLIQQQFVQIAKTMEELKSDIGIDVKEIRQNQIEQTTSFQEIITAQNCKISHLETDFLERIKDLEMSPAKDNYAISMKLKEKIIFAIIMGIIFAALTYLFPFISWK